MVTLPQVAHLARLSSHCWRMPWSPIPGKKKKKKKAILGSGHRDLCAVLLLAEANSYDYTLFIGLCMPRVWSSAASLLHHPPF